MFEKTDFRIEAIGDTDNTGKYIMMRMQEAIQHLRVSWIFLATQMSAPHHGYVEGAEFDHLWTVLGWEEVHAAG